MTPRPIRRARPVAATVLAAALAVAFGGCDSYSGTPSKQVREWASQADVTSNNATIVQDVEHLRRSVAARNLKTITTNCDGLEFDTGTAYGFLPAPDNALTNELNAAYQQFFSAGNGCADASSVGSPRIASALRDVSKGLDLLEVATRRLEREGVR